MRGRKPTPTPLKLLRGNPGKRRLNDREPRPKLGIPPCPRALDAAARHEWDEISKQLLDLGLLTKVDKAALAGYCANYSLFCRAQGEIKRRRFQHVTVNPKTLTLQRNPWLIISDRAEMKMKQFLIEFGLSPASRTRLKTLEPAAVDPLAAFLAKRPKRRR